MLAPIKYLMDENVDIAYCIQMRRRKPDGSPEFRGSILSLYLGRAR